MALAEGADFLFERGRAEIVGRGVDEIAGEIGGVGEPGDLGEVSTGDIIEQRRVTRFAIAIVAVGTEAEGQCRDGRIAEVAGKAVAPGLERRSGGAEDKGDRPAASPSPNR